MQGVETSHLNAAIAAVLKAYYDFRKSTVEDALRPIATYGKPDTLGMDAGPEITICEELGRYDAGAVVITEEIGSKGASRFSDPFRPNDPQSFRTVFISDPTDRSNQLREFLTGFPKEVEISSIFGSKEATDQWEAKFGSPAAITGATSAISCIRRGVPIFSVIVNYITQEMMVSCATGNRAVKLPDERPEGIDLGYVLAKGEVILFPGIEREVESMKRFVTFLGDAGKAGYRENFLESDLMSAEQMETFLHYNKPGGPSRILYLSTMQPHATPIGFILANGEKVGEWIHWLPYIQFAHSQYDDSQPALVLYEVFREKPRMKEGILMSTSPNYSIFREYGGKFCVDTNLLLRMSNPSKMRSTIIIAPFDNRWAVRLSSQSGYRPIRF